MRKAVPHPTYVPVPQSAAAMAAGPFRCPDCAGLVSLDIEQARAADVLFCPYCVIGLRIPAPSPATESKIRVRKIAGRNGIIITA